MFTSLRSRAVSHVNSDSDNDDKHLPMHIRVAILPHSLRPVPLTSTDGPMNTDQLKIVLQHMFMGPQHSSTGVVPYSGKPATSKPEKVLPQDVIAGQGPSPAYLKAAAIPSREIALKDRTKPPMVFISLDDVIDAPLPEHLVGGYTDVIARGYLDTLMDFLLRPKAGWVIAFFTKLPRKVALQRLRELSLPTGGPEKDARDGVVGVFSLSDLRRSRPGGPREIKDLEVLWQVIEEEEGVSGGPENTVVISNDQTQLRCQPYNLVCVPSYEYKSQVPAAYDQVLLMMIAVLKDLETENNFAYHIKELGWNNPMMFQDYRNPTGCTTRAMYTQMAVRICAQERIAIKAYKGNKYI